MEENKLYYTPKPTEFYLGFRYEVSNEILRGAMEIPPPEEWYKQIYDGKQPYTLDFLEYMLLNAYSSSDVFRVKFLDKDDIIECGFDTDVTLEYQKPDLIVCETSRNTNIHYYEVVYSINDNHLEVNDCEGLIFTGTIKNYNELKTLLKQLNIE